MNNVVQRRLEKCPDPKSRSSAAQMLAAGDELGTVLRQYPDAVPALYNDKPVRPSRRAIYAHYALLQEHQGNPDINPEDVPTVEKLILEHGMQHACARTGSALTKYRNHWPDLQWYKAQAPGNWFTEYAELLRRNHD